MTVEPNKSEKMKIQWWNIASKVEDEATAIELVKLGGFVGGYLAVSGVILIAVAWLAPDVVGVLPSERIYSLFGFGLQTIFGIALGFLVWRTQSWWAVAPLGIWAILEGLFKLFSVFAGGGAAGTVIAVIVLLATTQMVRGRVLLSLRRRQLAANPVADPD